MTGASKTLPSDCAAYQRLIQSVLDRESDLVILDQPHAKSCDHCADLRAGARQLQAWEAASHPVTVPQGLTERLNALLLQQARRQRHLRWLVRGSLLGLVLAVAVVLWPERAPLIERAQEQEVVPNPRPVPIPSGFEDRVSEAGSALFALTRKTTDETLKPAQNLFTWVDPLPPTDDTPTPLSVAGESLRTMPQSARAGLDPVTTGTKRAVSRLLRDLSAFTPSKPKS